jgi:hypothetical protein
MIEGAGGATIIPANWEQRSAASWALSEAGDGVGGAGFQAPWVSTTPVIIY